MPNEMKTAFDGLRAGVRDVVESKLQTLMRSMTETLYENLMKGMMSKEDARHMMWLTIADVSADKVRKYREDKP